MYVSLEGWIRYVLQVVPFTRSITPLRSKVSAVEVSCLCFDDHGGRKAGGIG